MTTNGHLLADLAAPLRAAGHGRGQRLARHARPRPLPRRHPARRSRPRGGRHRRGARRRDEGQAQRGRPGRLQRRRRGSGRAVPRSAGSAARRRASSSTCRCRTGCSTAPVSTSPAAPIRARLAAVARRGGRRRRPAGAARPARRATSAPCRRRRDFGIISAMSEHFCDTCNRLRLTSTGELHACLGLGRRLQPARILRSGRTDDEIDRGLIGRIAAAVSGKRAGARVPARGEGGPHQAYGGHRRIAVALCGAILHRTRNAGLGRARFGNRAAKGLARSVLGWGPCRSRNSMASIWRERRRWSAQRKYCSPSRSSPAEEGCSSTPPWREADYYKHVDEVTAKPDHWVGKRLKIHGFVEPGTIDEKIVGNADGPHLRPRVQGRADPRDRTRAPSRTPSGTWPRWSPRAGCSRPRTARSLEASELMAKCPSKYEAERQRQEAGPGLQPANASAPGAAGRPAPSSR